MSKALIEEVEAATETIQTLRNHMSDSVPIDVAEDILDVSQRLLAALKEREWLPIGEAPKDGSQILLYDETGIMEGRFYTTFDGQKRGFVNLYSDYINPTYYMPLLPAPEGE